MKTVNVSIQGTSPLLIHKFEEIVDEGPTGPVQKKKIPREEAQKVVYVTSDGKYFFPGTMITRTMANVASNYKAKRGRKSMKYMIMPAIRLTDDAIILLDPKSAKPIKNFEVDSRPVTIPSTKGRIMRHRPRFEEWRADFVMVVNDKLVSLEDAQKFLTDAGEQSGLGDFRPSTGGPFGCFRVIKWEEMTKQQKTR